MDDQHREKGEIDLFRYLLRDRGIGDNCLYITEIKNGFYSWRDLYFNKPLTWTSFDLVNKFRYKLSRKLKVKKIKVGHAGTLDPLATGVMIVCTGRATKRIDEFQYQTKEYIATLKLGETTPSFDWRMRIDAVYPTEHITRELVEEVLKTFRGYDPTDSPRCSPLARWKVSVLMS